MSVKVRKIGKAHGLRIDYQGRRKSISIGTKAAANAMKPKVEVELAAGRLGIFEKPSPTLKDITEAWLEFIEGRRAVSTYRRYEQIFRDKIPDKIKKTEIDKITRGDIRDVLVKHHNRGESKASVELIHTVLSGIFSYAVDDEVIQKSPTVGMLKYLDLKRAGVDEVEPMPLSSSEMDEALSIVTKDMYPIFYTLYQTGLRVGECLALQWGDIDFRNNIIRVSKTAKDQTIKNTTKTHLKREIEMSSGLSSFLMTMKAEDKKYCFANKLKQKQVFHKDGRLISDNTLRRRWSKACEGIGIGHRRVHDIRHTTASLLLMRGAPVLFVSNLLGHSSPKMTLDIYAKYIPDENNGFINLLQNSEDNCGCVADRAEKNAKSV